MRKLLHLEFIPRSVDTALLLLRVWLGVSMIALHGWGKLMNLIGGTVRFPDIFGIGPVPTVILAILAEVVAAALLVLGLWTRFAALLLVITMAVAFFMAHGAKLSGPGNGELAFIYLAGFVTLMLVGAGKFSIDRR